MWLLVELKTEQVEKLLDTSINLRVYQFIGAELKKEKLVFCQTDKIIRSKLLLSISTRMCELYKIINFVGNDDYKIV
jgi:hypothetical protein